MAEPIIINTTFLLRRGKEATWQTKNPLLSYGEPGFEKDTNRLKIGDGIHNWNELPYLFSNPRVKEDGAISLTSDNNDIIIDLKGFTAASANTIPIKTETGLDWKPINAFIQGDTNPTIYEILAGPNSSYWGEASLSTQENGAYIFFDSDYQEIQPEENQVCLYEQQLFKFQDNEWKNVSPITAFDFAKLTDKVDAIIASGGTGILGIASQETVGGVKSSNELNKINVDAETGTMSINKLSIDKLDQNNIELILDGGNAENDLFAEG